MNLVKTGIAGLDEFLTGGLPPKVLLLTGLPGTGNEVFARQVASACAKQNPITYFTVNLTSETIKEDMLAYNWDITPLMVNGNWKFKTITKTTNLIEAIVEEMRQGRTVIIDSISELLLVFKLEQLISLITEMCRQNRNGDCCHLLLLTGGMQDAKAETAIEHFSEGIIVFHTEWAADIIHRNLLVKKMQGAFIPQRRIPYSIGRRGFVIETATRIS
jgi:KaiC/GvpD/RAD55 family RecA-like ATPase